MIALVLGSANCLPDDLAALSALLGSPPMAPAQVLCGIDWPGIVIAANEAVLHYRGRIDHWVSLHPNKFAKWRELHGAWEADPPVTWSHDDPPIRRYADRHVALEPGGSSGQVGAWEVAVGALDCEAVVLCGIPLDKRPHIGRQLAWSGFTNPQNAWALRGPELAMRLRSMSGWTRELLGEPTEDWLEQHIGKVAA